MRFHQIFGVETTGNALSDTLPNFFILGAAKAGTTTLYDLLRRHPDVYLPPGKEPHFFDRDGLFSRGLGYYDATFYGREAMGKRARGDATPSYFGYAEWVAPRIAEAYGTHAPKFIVILRDPVDRAYSHYRHRVRNGLEPESFAAALEAENDRLAANPREWIGYFRNGLYSRALSVFWQHFGRDAMLVVRFENLVAEQQQVGRRVFAFLDVEPNVALKVSSTRNAAGVQRWMWLRRKVLGPSALKALFRPLVPPRVRRSLKYAVLTHLVRHEDNPPMPADVERALRARYAGEIDRLEAMLGWDLASWRGAAGT